MLLAESTALEFTLLRETFEACDEGTRYAFQQFDRHSLLSWEVDWSEFTYEYPQVRGTATEWKERLACALEPLWKELDHTSD